MKKILLMLAVLISGCVNQSQKITLNEDGSGEIKIEYSTKYNNLSAGDEIGGFAFSESKIKNQYQSENTDVNKISIDKNDKDSVITVNIDLVFKDFNKLSSSKAFAKSTTEWKKENDICRFKYYMLRDSTNASIPGMNEFIFKYEINFPGLVSETNGTKDGSSKVIWEIPVSDFKSNVELNAVITSESGGCGLFGIELPILITIAFLISGKKKHIKLKQLITSKRINTN